MTQDASYPRYRVRNSNRVLTVPYSMDHDIYDRYPTCSYGLAWRKWTTYTGTEQYGTAESMTDVLTPRYRAQSKAGRVFFNPMSHTKVTISKGTGSWVGQSQKETGLGCSGSSLFKYNFRFTVTAGSWGGSQSNFRFGGFNPSGGIDIPASIITPREWQSLEAEAVTACLSARGRSQDSNLWETSAEAEKALSLLPGILKNSYRTLKRNSSALRRAKAASSAYLAYRYGVQPIIGDVEAVKRGLLRTVGKVRRTSRGFANISKTSESRTTWTCFDSHIFEARTIRTDTLAFRAMSLDESRWEMMSNVGFTTKGLVTLPWELLPYSFVIDWFLNLGDFIGALYPAYSLNQLGSCVVLSHTQNYAFREVCTGATSGWTMISPPEPAEQKMLYEVRRRSIGLPDPSIVLRADFGFDRLKRVTDAIALVVQLLKNP